MRIIITGGRKYDDRIRIEEVLDEYIEFRPTIVHGGAGGVDSVTKIPYGADHIAGEVAEDFGFPVEVWKAKWQRYGRGAGPKRNQEMISEGADLVLAFPGGKGTADCVKRAERAKIRVRQC